MLRVSVLPVDFCGVYKYSTWSQFCCWIYFQPSDKHSKGSFGKLFWWHIPFNFFHFPFKSFPFLSDSVILSSIPSLFLSNSFIFPFKSFSVPSSFFHFSREFLSFAFHLLLWFFSISFISLSNPFPFLFSFFHFHPMSFLVLFIQVFTLCRRHSKCSSGRLFWYITTHDTVLMFFPPSYTHSKGNFKELFWWHISFKFFHFPFKSFPVPFRFFHSLLSIPFMFLSISFIFPFKSFSIPFRFFHSLLSIPFMFLSISFMFPFKSFSVPSSFFHFSREFLSFAFHFLLWCFSISISFIFPVKSSPVPFNFFHFHPMSFLVLFVQVFTLCRRHSKCSSGRLFWCI